MLRHLLLLFALVLASPAAHAQAVFRSVMPDGKIVYGDKPAPGAKEAKQVNLAPLNISTPGQGSSSTAPADGAAPAGNNAAEVAAARQSLDAAQKALEAGREQKEGDRIGTAKGSSRPTDDYVQRVKTLEDAVAAAQNQLNAAQNSAR